MIDQIYQFLIGNALWDFTEVDALVDVMGRIGEQAQEVCYFASHRVSDGYAFAKAVQNKMVRLYSYADGELFGCMGERQHDSALLHLHPLRRCLFPSCLPYRCFAYGIYIFHGNYDVPLKGSDKVQQRESEEVYSFLICAICPVTGDYEAGEPEAGFLFPEFRDRAGDTEGINLFSEEGHEGIAKMLL